MFPSGKDPNTETVGNGPNHGILPSQIVRGGSTGRQTSKILSVLMASHQGHDDEPLHIISCPLSRFTVKM